MAGNKLIRLSRTGIEYGEYAWNFYSGCRHKGTGVCPPDFNCWAESITKRYPAHYPEGFELHFYPEAFLSPLALKKPSRILCAFMGDLFGDWVDPDMNIVEQIFPYIDETETLKHLLFDVINHCPQHDFLFLTKAPWNYAKWGRFPDNCWLGATVTNSISLVESLEAMFDAEASIKYLSLEPLLEDPLVSHLDLKAVGIDWVIIGAATQPYRPPKIEWVRDIVEACDRDGIPVFLKDNLSVMFINKLKWLVPEWAMNKKGFTLRQEYPVAYEKKRGG